MEAGLWDVVSDGRGEMLISALLAPTIRSNRGIGYTRLAVLTTIGVLRVDFTQPERCALSGGGPLDLTEFVKINSNCGFSDLKLGHHCQVQVDCAWLINTEISANFSFTR
ncbi:hypothetical protein LDENG_00235260 [Lucifuga dentata]|nr:hypothetical protein LDENG_00235260 [Lucifuga dentata]